jgi:hypothetical protein
MATEKQIRNGADMEAATPPGSSPAARYAADQATAAAEVAQAVKQPGVHRDGSDVVQGPKQVHVQVVTPRAKAFFTTKESD